MSTMAKRRRKTTKSRTTEDGRRVTPTTGLPASQRVEAPPCQYCRSPETHIYATRKPVRYCKCKRCGWTWTFAVSYPKPGGDV